jgi:hypothetical protein
MGQTDSADVSLDSTPISLVDTSSLTADAAQLAASYGTGPAVSTGPSSSQIASQLIGTVGQDAGLLIAARSGSSLTASGNLVSPLASAASAAASTASSISSSVLIAGVVGLAIFALAGQRKHPREAN